MARKESIHYGFRLNINNPKQLKIHKVLRDLDPDLYRTKSDYIVEALEFYSDNEAIIKSDDLSRVKREGGYATVEFVNQMKRQIRDELEAEIKQELFAMFVAATGNSEKYSKSDNIEKKENRVSDKDNQEVKQVLNDLTDLWS